MSYTHIAAVFSYNRDSSRGIGSGSTSAAGNSLVLLPYRSIHCYLPPEAGYPPGEKEDRGKRGVRATLIGSEEFQNCKQGAGFKK